MDELFANNPYVRVKTTNPLENWRGRTGYITMYEHQNMPDGIIQLEPENVLVYLTGENDPSYEILIGSHVDHLEVIGTFEEFARENFRRLVDTDCGFTLLKLAKILWLKHGEPDAHKIELLRKELSKSRAYTFKTP